MTDMLSCFERALICRYVGNVCGAAAGMWLFELLWVGALVQLRYGNTAEVERK